MQERAIDDLVGAVVDQRYLVQARLARGGMSTVYLATDQRLERDVALKVMHSHLADDDNFLNRFSQEAKSAARLSHPHVVGVLDQGHDDALVYLVMEYVPGRTLRALIEDRGRLQPRLALALLDAVVDGLAAAHDAGLVHRDVKPENVLLADDGRIKVGDFGLARAVSTSTNTGTLIGTVAYIAPELVTGGSADERSDIYSVGIMLYEMLTGHHPYTGDIPIQVAFQHVNSEVPAPSGELPGLAEDLDELVQWCTAQDPESRPIDAAALLGELRHIRTTLSNEELDYDADSPGGTPPHRHTEVIRPGIHPTTVLSRDHDAGPSAPADPGSGPSASASGHIPGNKQDETQAIGSIRSSRAAKRDTKRDQKAQEKEQAKAAQQPEQSLRRGNPRRRALLWIAAVVLISLLVTWISWFVAAGPAALTSVPKVSGKPVAEARQLLANRGLESRATDIHHGNIPDGQVVRADPAASSELRKFEDVTLFVSIGPQMFSVPDVTGGTIKEAATELKDAQLAIGKVSKKYHEQIPSGTVLSQDVAPGEERRRDAAVAVVASKGPRPIEVPSVVRESRKSAVRHLSDAGLKPEVADSRVFHPSIREGRVVSQKPAQGQLFRGDTVTITLSKGPKMVDVPNLIGDQVEKSVQRLEKLGFKVEVNNILGGFFGTVRDQDPVDKSVPKGSTITLTVV
ncbi:Stk1 family PASTA domain-containing Ser/Thr kinase [Arthrobacter castelli]|uniref:Stk1 family PASTA domain-containing Ser/Thr kinase n=1 Tax=Arthrobacter castelli TaxID=271431 RepID=UPI00047ECC13|nr:PASTA domain-containing protein [Arthrobacter castelli]